MGHSWHFWSLSFKLKHIHVGHNAWSSFFLNEILMRLCKKNCCLWNCYIIWYKGQVCPLLFQLYFYLNPFKAQVEIVTVENDDFFPSKLCPVIMQSNLLRKMNHNYFVDYVCDHLKLKTPWLSGGNIHFNVCMWFSWLVKCLGLWAQRLRLNAFFMLLESSHICDVLS